MYIKYYTPENNDKTRDQIPVFYSTPVYPPTPESALFLLSFSC